MPEILEELARVQVELGNWWSVTPGSQILWTTAVSNVLNGRYERPSLDLQNLILGRYGPLPFYEPEDWICEKVLEYQRRDGKQWHRIIYDEGGQIRPHEPDPEQEGRRLEDELERAVSDEELALFLQFPFDTLGYLKFESKYGKTWLLPPEVWFRQGGFAAGQRIKFADERGVPHYIEIISTRREGGNVHTTLSVDHSIQTISVQVES
jgi:pyruvate carboxylase